MTRGALSRVLDDNGGGAEVRLRMQPAHGLAAAEKRPGPMLKKTKPVEPERLSG
jgi:hypothetical protein